MLKSASSLGTTPCKWEGRYFSLKLPFSPKPSKLGLIFDNDNMPKLPLKNVPETQNGQNSLARVHSENLGFIQFLYN